MVETKARSVHLIGIGGSGLSAIARLLLESGWQVSGSDRQLSPLARSLQEAGVNVMIGHRPENVAGADLVIRSSAISDDNVEVTAARQAGIQVVKRSDFLGQLMVDRQGIAVAGTHGKTTTTAMIAWMLTAIGQDPAYIIGGVSINLGNNAHAGSGAAFVIEADEYDRMFLGLKPQIEVILNVEHDHPDCYPTFDDFYQAFRSFVNCLSPSGWLVGCLEDPGAERLLSEARSSGVQVIDYSINRPATDFRAENLASQAGSGYQFDAVYPGGVRGHVSLQVPGLHNVRNALAALAVASILDLPREPACQALSVFLGTGRRFELRGEAAGVMVIDDYAHHPTEIQATLSAARQKYPGSRIWAVWQPHTFSRTQTLFDAFAGAFKNADFVIVTEVFASREAALAGKFSSQEVVRAMQHPGAYFVPQLTQAAAFLLERLQAGDVLIVMSAGDADQISTQVLAGLEEKAK